VRTVLITTSYPQSPGDPAGHFVETEALDLAREGHEVHVIAPGSLARKIDWSTNLSTDPPVLSTSTRIDWSTNLSTGPKGHGRSGGRGPVNVWGVGGGSLFGWPGALARARRNPFRLLQLADFLPGVRQRLAALAPIDRIVAHFIVPCGYPLVLGTRGAIEVVLHGSDVSVVSSLPSFARTHMVRRLLECEARFRFVSESLRASLLSKLDSPERERIRVRSRVQLPRISIHRVTEAQMHRCRSILGRGDRPKWIVCGRLISSKRVDLAIHEASRRGAQLTVIGDGPLRVTLEKLAVANEPRARFLGQLPRHEALAFLASADRLIHTSEAEGAPTVIREARALGIPVLAAPSGDVARWAEADPGIELLPPC
jgi:teichuronic acid biosynthesis glycosyltransferase TuaC